MEFFYLVKATQKSGKPDAVVWLSANTQSRAALQLDVALEDAGIETGRGKDYAKPVRTDFPVFNDLPEESTIDYTWCERYTLAEDQRTWNVIPGAASQSETTIALDSATSNVDLSDAPVIPFSSTLLANRTQAVRFAVHILGDKYLSEISQEQQIVANELAMDEGNIYFQNLLQAKNDVPDLSELSGHAEWKLVQAIKDVFPQDKVHEPAQMAAFMSSWIKAEAGARNQLVEDWKSGKLPAKDEPDYWYENGLRVHKTGDEFTRYPASKLPFRQQLLAQLTVDELRHHVNRGEHAELHALEMDTDNSYVQTLLLAAESCPELKDFDTKALWSYADAIRKVFSKDKRHELALVLRFTRIWVSTEASDHEILTSEWAAGTHIDGVGVPQDEKSEEPQPAEPYKRAVPQNMANLSIEIAIAQLYPDAVPGKINRAQLMAAKELADKKDEAHSRALKVLGKTSDITDYNADSIFGIARAIPWSDELTTVELRKQVREWFTANGIYENGERSKGYPEWDEDPRAGRQTKVEEPTRKEVDDGLAAARGEFVEGISDPADPKWVKEDLAATSQPQVANLGGGVFSIDGLLGGNTDPVINTPSNAFEKTETVTENSSDVQMEEAQPEKVEVTDAVSPSESTDAADPQTDALKPAEVLAAAVPELANATQPEVTTEAPEETASAPEYPAYFEPGRYEGLPNNVYHAANGISSTQVKDARVSLMFYHGRHVTKTIRRESSEALTFGSLAHTLALEPEKLHEEFAVFPGVPEEAFTTTDSMKAFIREYNADKPKAEQLKLTGKKDELQAAIRAVNPNAIFADEFEQEWRDSVAGKTILSSEQLALATAIQQALLNHESAGKLLRHPSRSVETSYFGMDDETGLEVRVRPDLEVEINGVRIGVDLKTISMGRVKQDGLRAKLHREIIDRDYHLSAGMYCTVADFDQFFWIFVNKDEGYHWVAVIEASDDLLALGVQEYQKTMHALAQAYDTNCWPAPITEDYTDELNDFDLRRLEALRLA
ncbi:Exodeoxyribonuclease 8 [Leclercia adecarboxylata]|uniref:Exodeoxyribonuclease n=1 Tax=Leclercia adecarboxylata TaxID=83655 RepID=A0A855EJC4_9ENTR|nr:RecE family exodeoxyribonuclease [Leclercia adecarboxylata]KFC89444.1 exodeoxyribonuclease VIII [Leclercia adecarboxylata ATCC 23216 = NBRC 102595]PHH04073.1 exodeoxyribonuclease [Leclercia adecarboxylata]UBH69317.1 PD-(D/E)XK nuclease-like domain-containing protein [Leclercia adecarboxylata]SPX62914.1 Exodeoxyribonuclease 8 [Leclercia adecarboxylata]